MQILLVSFVSSLVSAQVAAYASLQTISADEFKNSKAEILNKPSEAFERLISAQYQSFIHKMQTPIKNQFYSTPYHPSPENIRKSIKNQKQDIELDEDEDYTDYQHQQGNPDLTLKYDAGEIAGTAGNSLYSLPSQYGMDHAAFALAILAILAGTFMLLFGQRVLKPILFMIGFMILGTLKC